MTKFRPRIGYLYTESMKYVFEFNTIEELKDHINKTKSKNEKDVEDIKFEYQGYDHRIDWDNYFVMCKYIGSDEFVLIGYSNGKL